MRDFGLEKYIRYNTEVLMVEQKEDFEDTGRWNITLRTKVGNTSH